MTKKPSLLFRRICAFGLLFVFAGMMIVQSIHHHGSCKAPDELSYTKATSSKACSICEFLLHKQPDQSVAHSKILIAAPERGTVSYQRPFQPFLLKPSLPSYTNKGPPSGRYPFA